MENGLFYEEIEKSNEANTDMRKTTAKNIVMMSHVSMKLHFVKLDVDKMQEQDEVLKERMLCLRQKLLSWKEKITTRLRKVGIT